MALNIAVPLSGVGGLSPISPIGIECWENIELLCSPIGSESSGVSSLDSLEEKQSIQQQPLPQKQLQHQQQEKQPSPPKLPEDLKILYNRRDILDLGYNINPRNQELWNLCYTYLPENNNMPMFFANRSQYHRLGANGHIQEYSLAKCEDCDFLYPINSSSNIFCQTSVTYSPTTNSAMTYAGFSTINNHHLSNNYRNHQKHINTNTNIYPNHINLTDNLFSNSFLKKTNTIITNNSTTTTPTMSITPTSLTAATSPTSSGYSSSSSIGKYQLPNNNNFVKNQTTNQISNNNFNNVYTMLSSLNNFNNGTNNAMNNNNSFNNNNAAANTNTNINHFNNNNHGFLNAQMYKYF